MQILKCETHKLSLVNADHVGLLQLIDDIAEFRGGNRPERDTIVRGDGVLAVPRVLGVLYEQAAVVGNVQTTDSTDQFGAA